MSRPCNWPARWAHTQPFQNVSWPCTGSCAGGGMRRREFIGVLGGAAAWPLTAHAQQINQMRRIGVLLVSGPEPLGPFREALGDLGYVEGKNIQFEVRSAQGQDARLPELAAELVRSQVDVIVAVQTPAAQAAKNATRNIPIVMMAGDPIATGLVSNLARPDGNVTGLSATAAEAAAKSLELIPEIIAGSAPRGPSGQCRRSVHEAIFRANPARRPNSTS